MREDALTEGPYEDANILRRDLESAGDYLTGGLAARGLKGLMLEWPSSKAIPLSAKTRQVDMAITGL